MLLKAGDRPLLLSVLTLVLTLSALGCGAPADEASPGGYGLLPQPVPGLPAAGTALRGSAETPANSAGPLAECHPHPRGRTAAATPIQKRA